VADKRTDLGSVPPFTAGSGTSRQSANCEAAAARAAAFAVSSRRSAKLMAASKTYWGDRGARPDISALYADQMEAYYEIARQYEQMEARAHLLAHLFREIGTAAGKASSEWSGQE
jgi:hypothetical protein